MIIGFPITFINYIPTIIAIKSLYIYILYPLWCSNVFLDIIPFCQQKQLNKNVYIYIYSFCKVPPSYKLICKPHEYEFVISTINPNVSCSPTFSSKDITSKTSSFLDSTIIFHHLKPPWFPNGFLRFSPCFPSVFPWPVARTFHRFEAGSSSMVCSGEQSKTVESKGPGDPRIVLAATR